MAVAQTGLHFEYVDTRGRAVYSLAKDRDDIVWAGTGDGLVTFAQLMSQNPVSYHSFAAADNVFSSIEQDKTGALWMRARTNYYYRYDPQTNRSDQEAEDYLASFGIHIRHDFRLHVGTDSTLWVHNDTIIHHLDPVSRKRQQLTVPRKDGRIVFMLCTKGEAVVVMSRAIYLLNEQTMRLRRLCATPTELPYEETRLDYQRGKAIYLGTIKKLYRYDLRSKQWRQYDEPMYDACGMARTSDDRLYVATTNSGLYVIDGEGRVAHHLTASLLNEGGLVTDQLMGICYDGKAQNLWLLHAKEGMSVCNMRMQSSQMLRLPQTSGQQGGNDVISMAEERDGSYWVGTENNGIFHLSANHKVLANSHAGLSATALFVDSSGRVWSGLYGGGLHCSDGRSYFPGESPYKIVEGEGVGVLYVLLQGKGLYRLDTTTGATRHYATELAWMNDMAFSAHTLYSSSPKNIYRIDTRTGENRMVSAEVFGPDSYFGTGSRTMLMDHRGWLWLVSFKNYSDIYIYDTRRQRAFTFQDARQYRVSSLVEDTKGQIWMATDQGLLCVQVKDERQPRFSSYCYHINGDYTTLYNERAIALFSGSRLMLGSTIGYQLVDLDRLVQYRPQPISHNPLILASLRVNGIYVTPNDSIRRMVESELPFVSSIDLAYDENNLILEMLPRDYIHDASVSYHYQLRGLSDHWLPMTSYQVVLSNLPSGRYQLMVRRAEYEDGKMRHADFEMLTIHVRPPFWATWWAYLIYIGMVAAAAWGIYRYYDNRRLYRERMREAAREAEMNQMKLNFFLQVSHDLRTPLTVIISSVEDLLDRLKEPETLTALEAMQRNAKRLFTLVNQMLDLRRLMERERAAGKNEDNEALMGLMGQIGQQEKSRSESPSASPTPSNPLTPFTPLPSSSTENSLATLLIVEDNLDLQAVLARRLSPEFTICQATDGQAALDILRGTDVDIIVSDVMMEGMDGLEFCRRVKSDVAYSHIPLILLTARTLASDELHGLQMGADDYMTKPFSFDVLRQRILTHLRRRQQAQQQIQQQGIDVAPESIDVTTLDQQLLAKAMESIERHMDDAAYTVDILAEDMSLSRTNMFKKVQALTGKTPSQFIRMLRLKRARQLLQADPELRVSDVAFKVGYNSAKIFSRQFKEEFGVLPSTLLSAGDDTPS